MHSNQNAAHSICQLLDIGNFLGTLPPPEAPLTRNKEPLIVSSFLLWVGKCIYTYLCKKGVSPSQQFWRPRGDSPQAAATSRARVPSQPEPAPAPNERSRI